MLPGLRPCNDRTKVEPAFTVAGVLICVTPWLNFAVNLTPPIIPEIVELPDHLRALSIRFPALKIAIAPVANFGAVFRVEATLSDVEAGTETTVVGVVEIASVAETESAFGVAGAVVLGEVVSVV